jgi:hypothetical protein
LIDDIFSNKIKQIDETHRKDAKLEYDFPNDPRNPTLVLDRAPSEIVPSIVVPESSLSSTDHICVMQNGSGFLDLNGNLYITLNDLTKLAETNSTGFKFFKLDSNQFEALLERSKQNGAKLTSVLCMINFLALESAVEKFASNAASINELVCSVPINMRQFLEPKVEYRIGSNFMSRLAINLNRSIIQRSAVSNTLFWEHAKNRSELLHERLNNGDAFKVLEDIAYLIPALYSGFKPKNVGAHFVISNIGDQSQLYDLDESSNIRVVQSYSGTSFKPKENSGFCQNGIVTINKELFWSITYGKNDMSQEFIDHWYHEISRIISRIIQ